MRYGILTEMRLSLGLEVLPWLGSPAMLDYNI